MKKKFSPLRLALIALALVGITAARPAAAAPLAVSAFDNDAEGWTVFNDGAGPIWSASGGNPGGYIYATDLVLGSSWYFQAPTKFLGDISAAYDQTLTFDLKQSTTANQYNSVDVLLSGGGLTLVYDTAVNPATDWTPYMVLLDETAGWKKSTLSGVTPSQAEFQTVLSSLNTLRIRGEYSRNGADIGGLDNVVLNAAASGVVPEPGTLTLLALGIISGSFGFCRRRSR
jgi:hypothetical protein